MSYIHPITVARMRHTLFSLLTVFALLSAGSVSLFSQTTSDEVRYQREAAAARKEARRELQAERADAARQAELSSEVAAEDAAYRAEVARVQQYNNRVADYMTRDIAHRLVFWGNIGFTTMVAWNPGGMPWDQHISPFFGGGVGIGYQLRSGLFLFTTGLDVQSLNGTLYRRDRTSPTYPSDPYTIIPLHPIYLSVPLLFGQEFEYWYWQLGVKVGYGFNPYNTPLRTAYLAEFGMNFDHWSRPVIPAGQTPTDKQRTALRMHYKLSAYLDGGCIAFFAPSDVSVGLKFSVAYQFQRKQKQMLPMPTRPRPEMLIEVQDADGKPVHGAIVAVNNLVSGGTTHLTTSADGKATIKIARGEYKVAADKRGMASAEQPVSHSDLNGDTLILRLQPQEGGEVSEPLLVGRVCDSETHQPLPATIRFGNWIDTTALYRGYANAEGVYATRLRRGDYNVRVRQAGYMPLHDAVHFEHDSLVFMLRPIKRGVTAKVRDLFFKEGRAVILPESETSIADLALFLRQNPTVRIRLTAHTADNGGNSEALLKLSERRARMLRRNLINRGIDADRIEAVGLGAAHPVADNNTETGRALNERMVMEIIEE